jgi:hypothetical protein
MSASLERLDQWESLCILARIAWQLATSWESDLYATQRKLVPGILNADVIDRLNAFVAENSPARVAVFFPQQILEAMRWTIVLGKRHPQRETQPLEDRKRDLTALLLGAAEIWGDRQEALFHKAEAVAQTVAQLRAYMTLFSRTGMSAIQPSRSPIMSLARASHLYGDLMPRHLPSFPQVFKAETGLSFDEYNMGQNMIWAQIIQRTDRNPLLSFESNDHSRNIELGRHVMRLQSQSLDEARASLAVHSTDPARDWSLDPLRKQPAVRNPDRGDSFLVLDPKVFSDSISNGPLFLSPDAQIRNQMLSSFGAAFEDYTSEIMSGIYPESPLGICCRKDVAIQIAGVQVGQVDAYVNYHAAAILIETKASFVAERSAVIGDPVSFLSDLEDKYVKSSEGHPKGVSQLSSTIRKLAYREWLGVEEELGRVQTPFPVLVVNDERLEDPLAARYLAKRLQEQLGSLREEVVGVTRVGALAVAALTIVPVDLLEVLEESTKRFSLLDLLRDFTDQCPDRIVSLNNFIAGSRYGSLLLSNPRLARLMNAKVERYNRSEP